MHQTDTMRVRWTVVVLCLWMGVGHVAAQRAVVRGFVSEAGSEQVLQGASVGLRAADGRLLGAVTDGDGYFIITRVPPGRYTLRITFVGFAPYEETLDLVAGAVLRRRVVLAPQEAALEEVVVSADAEQWVTAVAAGLAPVVPAQIARVPIPGVSGDLAAYLQTLPGITVQGDRGGLFFVRGGALDQNLALLDGLPVYMPFHVLSFYSAFPEAVVDEADVYTGGFGARYGSRLSSIMDVRARNGNKQQVAGAASVAPFLSTVRIEGPLVRDRVSVLGSVRHSLVEAVMPDLFGQNLPYRFGDQFGKVHAFLSPHHSLSVTALHTFDRGDIAGTRKTFEGDRQAAAPNDSSEVAWENTVVGGTYTYLSGFLPLLARITVGRSEMTSEMGPPDARERRARIASVDLAAEVTYFLGANELRVGGIRRASTLSYELGGQFQGLPEVAGNDLTEVMGYVEADVRLAGVRLQAGGHLYALPARGRQWLDPRLRFSWRPAAGRWQVHAAWGVYHQVVAGLNDERDIGNLFTAWVPTPDGAPVPGSMHALAGGTLRLAPGLSVAAEAFFKNFHDLSVPVFSAFPAFTTALQPADGEALGADLRLDFRDRPFWFASVLDGYASYALSKVTYQTAQGTYHPAHDRRHQVNILLHARKEAIGVTIQFQYGTGLPFTESGGFDKWLLLTPEVNVGTAPGRDRILYGPPFGGRQPSYQRLDFWLERRVERGRTVATLRLGALNLFNRHNLFYYDLFTFSRVDQLPFVPSVGLKIAFR